jgi:hypothetical protein
MAEDPRFVQDEHPAFTPDEPSAGSDLSGDPLNFALNYNPSGDMNISLGQGAVKGAISTVHHVGNLVEKIPGVKTLDDLYQNYIGKPAPSDADYQALTESQNPAQGLGKLAEQTAEFAMPSGAVGDLLKSAPLLARMLGQGAVSGGVGLAQTGSAKQGLMDAILGSGAEALPQALQAAGMGNRLDLSAEKNYAKAINPTTRANKSIVQNVVAPGLADRGVVATSLEDLKSKAADQMENFGQQIDDYATKNADVPMNAAGVQKKLDDLIAARTINGVVPSVNQPYVETLKNLKDEIGQVAQGKNGVLTLGDARSLRQQYDSAAAAKNAFALAPADQSKVAGIVDGTNAIRSGIADQFPALADINKEYSFWKNTHDVSDATLLRTQGQKPALTTTLARAGGLVVGAHGGWETAIGTSEALGALTKLRNSFLWNSVSAESKGRIADLIANGRADDALKLAQQAGLSALSVIHNGRTAQPQPAGATQ